MSPVTVGEHLVYETGLTARPGTARTRLAMWAVLVCSIKESLNPIRGTGSCRAPAGQFALAASSLNALKYVQSSLPVGVLQQARDVTLSGPGSCDGLPARQTGSQIVMQLNEAPPVSPRSCASRAAEIPVGCERRDGIAESPANRALGSEEDASIQSRHMVRSRFYWSSDM